METCLLTRWKHTRASERVLFNLQFKQSARVATYTSIYYLAAACGRYLKQFKKTYSSLVLTLRISMFQCSGLVGFSVSLFIFSSPLNPFGLLRFLVLRSVRRLRNPFLLEQAIHTNTQSDSFASTRAYKMNFQEFTLIQNELQSAIEWANNAQRTTHTHTQSDTLIFLVSNFMHDFSYLFLIPESIFRYFTAAVLFVTSFFLFLFTFSLGSSSSSFFAFRILFLRLFCVWIGNCASCHALTDNGVNHGLALRFSYVCLRAVNFVLRRLKIQQDYFFSNSQKSHKVKIQ